MAEPDPYTSAWYAKQFKGITHLLNRMAADYEDTFKLVTDLHNRVTVLEGHKPDEMAKIGELIARLDAASQAYATLSKRVADLESKKPKDVP